MKGEVLGTIAYGALALLLVDLMIVATAMAQIAAGISTPHIPFWDAQIKFVVSVIN